MGKHPQVIVIERHPSKTGCLVRTEPVRVLRYELHIEAHGYAQSYAHGLSSWSGMAIVDHFVEPANVSLSPSRSVAECWYDSDSDATVFDDGPAIIHRDETLDLEEYEADVDEFDMGEAA